MTPHLLALELALSLNTHLKVGANSTSLSVMPCALKLPGEMLTPSGLIKVASVAPLSLAINAASMMRQAPSERKKPAIRGSLAQSGRSKVTHHACTCRFAPQHESLLSRMMTSPVVSKSRKMSFGGPVIATCTAATAGRSDSSLNVRGSCFSGVVRTAFLARWFCAGWLLGGNTACNRGDDCVPGASGTRSGSCGGCGVGCPVC